MTYGNGANGAAQEWPESKPITMIGAGDHSQLGLISPERFEGIRERLTEPFDPSEIKWRVTANSRETWPAEARPVGRVCRPARVHRSPQRSFRRVGLDAQL